MHSLNNRQSGFGSVAILATVVAVLVVGGIGLIISNKHTKTAPAKAATSTIPPAPRAPATPVTPIPAIPTSAGATLTVKEWGVEIPLPDSLKDAYYVPSTGSADPDGSINTIWIGLKSKDTATCAAALGNKGGSTLAGIVRVLPTDTDPVTGKLYTEILTNGVTIGKYYYGFGPSLDANNKCGSVASRSDINIAFGAATKNAMPVSAQPAPTPN